MCTRGVRSVIYRALSTPTGELLECSAVSVLVLYPGSIWRGALGGLFDVFTNLNYASGRADGRFAARSKAFVFTRLFAKSIIQARCVCVLDRGLAIAVGKRGREWTDKLASCHVYLSRPLLRWFDVCKNGLSVFMFIRNGIEIKNA